MPVLRFITLSLFIFSIEAFAQENFGAPFERVEVLYSDCLPLPTHPDAHVRFSVPGAYCFKTKILANASVPAELGTHLNLGPIFVAPQSYAPQPHTTLTLGDYCDRFKAACKDFIKSLWDERYATKINTPFAQGKLIQKHFPTQDVLFRGYALSSIPEALPITKTLRGVLYYLKDEHHLDPTAPTSRYTLFHISKGGPHAVYALDKRVFQLSPTTTLPGLVRLATKGARLAKKIADPRFKWIGPAVLAQKATPSHAAHNPNLWTTLPEGLEKHLRDFSCQEENTQTNPSLPPLLEHATTFEQQNINDKPNVVELSDLLSKAVLSPIEIARLQAFVDQCDKQKTFEKDYKELCDQVRAKLPKDIPYRPQNLNFTISTFNPNDYDLTTDELDAIRSKVGVIKTSQHKHLLVQLYEILNLLEPHIQHPKISQAHQKVLKLYLHSKTAIEREIINIRHALDPKLSLIFTTHPAHFEDVFFCSPKDDSIFRSYRDRILQTLVTHSEYDSKIFKLKYEQFQQDIQSGNISKARQFILDNLSPHPMTSNHLRPDLADYKQNYEKASLDHDRNKVVAQTTQRFITALENTPELNQTFMEAFPIDNEERILLLMHYFRPKFSGNRGFVLDANSSQISLNKLLANLKTQNPVHVRNDLIASSQTWLKESRQACKDILEKLKNIKLEKPSVVPAQIVLNTHTPSKPFYALDQKVRNPEKIKLLFKGFSPKTENFVRATLENHPEKNKLIELTKTNLPQARELLIQMVNDPLITTKLLPLVGEKTKSQLTQTKTEEKKWTCELSELAKKQMETLTKTEKHYIENLMIKINVGGIQAIYGPHGIKPLTYFDKKNGNQKYFRIQGSTKRIHIKPQGKIILITEIVCHHN